MKIIFLTGGDRDDSLKYLIKKKLDIVAIVTPKPNKKNTRFLNSIKTAKKNSIKNIFVNKDNIEKKLKNIDFDLLISCGFTYILTKKVIRLAKKDAINVHPTLLPKYRGFRSGPYIIMNDEKETGVTIHQISNNMDRGDIYLQKKIKITKFDTTKSIYRRCKEIEPNMIYKVIKLIEKNKINPLKQDERKSSRYDYVRIPKDSEVNINLPLKDLYNIIRASDYTDYPAHFFINGKKVLIKLERENKVDKFGDLI